MPYTVTLPDNTTVDIDDNIPPEEASKAIKSNFPEAFMREPGTLDVTKQPKVKNPDGSISTVRTIGINEDGSEIVIPTVSPEGKNLTPDQATELYHSSGKHLGKFMDVESANAFAQRLHEREAKRIKDEEDRRVKGDDEGQTPAIIPDTAETNTFAKPGKSVLEAGIGTASAALANWWSGATPKQIYYNQKLANLDQEERDLQAGRITNRERARRIYNKTPEEIEARLKEIQTEKADFQKKYSKNVEALNVAQQIQDELTPEDANIFQQGAISFVGSSPNWLAALGVGTINPAAGVAVGSAMGFGSQAADTIREARQAGATPEVAQRAGFVNGALEAAGDALGLDKAFKLGKGGMLSFVKLLGYNGSQESVTQFFEDLVSKAQYDPNKSWEEMGRNAMVAFIAGGMGGAAAHPVIKAVESGRQEVYDKKVSELKELFAQQGMSKDLDVLNARRDALMTRANEINNRFLEYGKDAPMGEDIQPLLDNLMDTQSRLEAGERWTKVMKDVQDPILRAMLNNTTTKQKFDIQNPTLTKISGQFEAVTKGYVKDLAARGEGRLYKHMSNQDPNENTWGLEPGEDQQLGDSPVTHSTGSLQQFTSPTVKEVAPTLKRGDVIVAPMRPLSDQEQRNVDGLVKTVQYWSKKMGYDRPIIITNLDPATASRRGFASKHGNSGVMSITSLGEGSAESARVAVHEFGHLIFTNEWMKAAPEVKNALIKAWQEDTQNHLNLPINEAMQLRRGPLGEDYTATVKAREAIYGDSSLSEFPRYLFSFREFQAHQMERMLEGNTLGMKTPVKMYLKNILGELRKFWNNVKGEKYQPNSTFKDFVHSLVLREQIAQLDKRIVDLHQEFDSRFMKAPDNEALNTLSSEALEILWLPGDQTDLGTGLPRRDASSISTNNVVFTRPEVSQAISQWIKSQPWFASIRTVVDPSAGNGAFSSQFPGSISMDLDPRAPGIKKQDFLKFDPKGLQGPVLVVGNPPFGTRGKIARQFMSKAADFADYVAFVLPQGFSRPVDQSYVDRRLTLVGEFPMPPSAYYTPDSGSVTHVPSVFQVWKRQDRAAIAKATSPHFTFGNVNDFDFAIARTGSLGSVGRIVPREEAVAKYTPGTSSVIFVKASPETSPEDLKRAIENADYSDQPQQTRGLVNLDQASVVRAINRELDSGKEAQEELPRSEMTVQWNKLLKKAGLPPSQKFNQDMDSFSKFKQLCYGLLEIAFANRHITQLYNPLGVNDPVEGRIKYGYVDYVLMMHRARMKILQMADQTMKLWSKINGRLTQEQQEGLNQFIVDQVLQKKFFNLNDPQVLLKYKLTPDSLELYRAIQGNFSEFLNQFEQMQLTETRIRRRNHPNLASSIKDVQEKFAKLRSIPYFPLMRFGEWVVTVRADNDTVVDGKKVKKGDTIIRAHFPRKAERDKEAKKLSAEWQGHLVHTTQLPGTVQGMTTLPREFLEAVQDKLDLTEKQQEALNQYLLDISPANAFSKRLMHRRGTAGFSMDLQRSFAAYFATGSNFLARAQYRSDLKRSAQELRLTDTDSSQYGDTTLRSQIATYVEKHLDFILNPENDWSNIKAPIAVAYLTLVFKTAFVNMTQPWLVTAPWLSKRFGTTRSVEALAKAYNDLGRMYQQMRRLTTSEQAIVDKWLTSTGQLTPDESSFIERWTGLKLDETEALNTWLEERNALKRGVEEAGLDESLAMEMAGWAEGGLLQRVMKTNPVSKGFTTMGQIGMKPFEMVEKMNRRVTFLAAYRLAREGLKGEGAGLDIAPAAVFAREAVQSTQFEYSKFNRAPLTRGKQGLALMFTQYPLGMFRLMAGGDEAWKRILVMAFLAGGFWGLPFAENINDLLKLIDGIWGRLSPGHKKIDLKYELKKYLEEFGEMPENLFLHGASRYGFGIVPWADLSGSMSMGRLIPGTDAAAYWATTGDFDAAMRMAVTEAGGAAGSMAMRMLQAATMEGPAMRRLETGMPVTAIQQLMTLFRWYETGAEELRSGANVVEFDPSDPWQAAEMAGKALGFQPRSLATGRGTSDELGYEELRMRREFAQYYTARRQMLLNVIGREHITSEEKSEAVQNIRDFNRDVPFKSMVITGEQIRNSLISRNKTRFLQERGLDVQKSEAGVMREIGQRHY